jgi:hypothetical protein
MKNEMMDDDVENVGIMQGFLSQVGEEEDELEEEEGSEEASAARVLNRRPDSPEILMNNLRGDMRSVDARREELADLVGYEAAAETPDTVLAMLQPVLAQQGGLGALPQSGPMAQGPQAPMMPPPSGGAMGAPPPGAPPLPPGGPPPPAGGDMAALLAAGPPPGGGMAPGGPPPGAGPMIGPDGQPIPPEGMPPIQMYRGGEVKRFSDGSPDPDEVDEETQKNEFESGSFYDLAATSPDVIRLAEQQASNLLRRKAMKIPTRQEAMEGILPEYEKLAGVDPKMAQANLLFDIAGAALGYAANRGPGGEALRGSPFSRFAGAFSGVPANIQKRVADIERSKQQLRILALDAGEKERKLLQDYNTKLSSEQGTLALKLLDAKAKADRIGAGAGAFGSSLTGRTINMFSTMAPAFAAARTTPAQDRAYIEGLNAYMKPTTQINPQSGETVVVMPPISPVVERSLSKRGFSIVTDKDDPYLRRISSSDPAVLDYLLELTGATPTEAAPSEAAAAPATTTAPVTPGTTRPVGGSTAAPTGQPPVTVLGGSPLPPDMAGADVAGRPAVTLMDTLPAFGLFPGLRRALGKLPFEPAGEAFGKDVALENTATELTAFLREEYTDAGKILAAERTDLSRAINGIPSALKTNPAEAYKRFASLTSSFKRARDDALRVAADPVALDERLKSQRLQNYNIKTRQDFLLRAQRFQNMIDAIGLEKVAPVVVTEDELNRFLTNCKPGVPCFFTRFEDGDYKLTEIVLPEQ